MTRAAMGLFRRKPDNSEQIEQVVTDLQRFKERLDRADAEKATLQHQVDVLRADNARLTEQLMAPPAEPPPPPLPASDPRVDRIEDRVREIDRLHQQLHSLSAVVARSAEETAAIRSATLDESRSAQTDAVRAELAQLAEKMASLDARVTHVSTELANQVTELGHEIDAARADTESEDSGDRPDVLSADEIESRITQLVEEHVAGRLDDRVDAAVDGAFGDVVVGQERLANEQARFEIQFREDLAELAERIRRPGSRDVLHQGP